jgi:hypothetical protein
VQAELGMADNADIHSRISHHISPKIVPQHGSQPQGLFRQGLKKLKQRG